MAPTLSQLESLHRAHSFTWAFETFDVFLSGTNRLDRAGLEAKFRPGNRGGWCFELNEWLALRLEDEGFRVRRLLARNVRVPDRPRTHQIVLVEAGGDLWIADAGFAAQTLREPMKLEPGYERIQDGLPYRLDRRAASGSLAEPESWVLQVMQGGEWRDTYRFTLETATAEDFGLGNHFHLTHPGSSFCEQRVVAMPVEGGRISLADQIFKTFRNTSQGEVLVSETVVTDRNSYRDLLADQFRVRLGPDAVARLWERLPSVSRGTPPLVDGAERS
jgi:N-hydroxyarylamine O-acetyltransferase